MRAVGAITLVAVLSACGANGEDKSVVVESTAVTTNVVVETTMAVVGSSSTTSSLPGVVATAVSTPPTATVPASTLAPRPVATVSSAPPTTSGPAVVTLSIPLGTAARIVAGDDVGNVLPPSLSLSVGSQLVIVNNDDAFHTYGPLSARPGETVRYEFVTAGSFQGLCTTNASRVVTIEVA